jgi:hypothetical protein
MKYLIYNINIYSSMNNLKFIIKKSIFLIDYLY